MTTKDARDHGIHHTTLDVEGGDAFSRAQRMLEAAGIDPATVVSIEVDIRHYDGDDGRGDLLEGEPDEPDDEEPEAPPTEGMESGDRVRFEWDHETFDGTIMSVEGDDTLKVDIDDEGQVTVTTATIIDHEPTDDEWEGTEIMKGPTEPDPDREGRGSGGPRETYDGEYTSTVDFENAVRPDSGLGKALEVLEGEEWYDRHELADEIDGWDANKAANKLSDAFNKRGFVERRKIDPQPKKKGTQREYRITSEGRSALRDGRRVAARESDGDDGEDE